MNQKGQYLQLCTAISASLCMLMIVAVIVAGPLFFLMQGLSLIVALEVTSAAAMGWVLFQDRRNQSVWSMKRRKLGKWILAIDCVPAGVIVAALFLFPIASSVGA